MALLEKPKETHESYIALLIDEESVQTGIWQIKDSKTRVLSIGERQNWEGKKGEELAESVDISLSAAVAKLAEIHIKEPEKVILGLPQSWTENGKIVKEKLALLKQLSKKLALKPVGFVVATEALAHFLKAREGTPVSAILIGLNTEKIEVALVHLGKILGIESVARSDNLALDVEEGLLRFPKGETFPPRMILYGGGDFESEKQTLVSYPWQEPERKLPFLHFPRVEVTSQDFSINALCLAGGTEIAKSEELTGESEERGDAEGVEAREEAKVPDEKPVITEVPARQGFPTQRRDTGGLRGTEALKKTEEVDQAEQAEKVAEEDLGFVVGKDVLVEGVKEIKETEEKRGEKVEEVAQVEHLPAGKAGVEKVEEVGEAEEVKSQKSKVKSFLFLILAKIRVPRLRLPKLKLPSFAFAPPKLAFVGIFLVVFGILFWVYKTVPKAQVTIFVSPEELKEEFELTLDSNAVTWDEKEKILPAQTTEASVSQSKTTITTGKKTVGDKAKGEVTIYNRTDNQKTFAVETVLVGPGGLKFTLDSDVSVASKTPDLVSGVDRWGEAKVGVTAADIGAEYNLAADSQFSFEDFSSSLYLAKNTTAFSGGTSRQVQVVSEEDRVSLKKDLESELENRAKDEIRSKIATDQYFVEESLQVEISQEIYNRKVGEESQEISLDLTVKATGLTFEENTLKDFLRLLLKDRIGDQDLRWDEVELGFEVIEVNDDGSVQFKTHLTGSLYPALSEAGIVQSLRGKSLDFQKDYLNNLPKVTGFETEITPAFFARLGRLPSLEKNISIEVRAE